jgi:hypothetical protein
MLSKAQEFSPVFQISLPLYFSFSLSLGAGKEARR